ncbi:MAG: type II toxin-antitoxin system YoeB family toxin [Cuspidothrix sp.]
MVNQIWEITNHRDTQDTEKEDYQLVLRSLTLIKDIQRNPFFSIGKPEPLKYELHIGHVNHLISRHPNSDKINLIHILFTYF